MAPQIQVDSNCLNVFNDFKISSGNKKLLVLKVRGDQVEVDQDLSNIGTNEELCSCLPDNEAKFILHHLEFDLPSNNERTTKMVLVIYIPEGINNNTIEKVKLPSAILIVKENFGSNVSLCLEVSSKDEMTREALVERCLKVLGK
ncbi:hypothetical protein ABK040_005662 [Willaertia magna]